MFGTSLKSRTSKGAVRNSLRAKLVRVLPKSATSDRELATLQSTRKVPSTATVGGGGDSREDCSTGTNGKHDPNPENAAASVIFPPSNASALNITIRGAPARSDANAVSSGGIFPIGFYKKRLRYGALSVCTWFLFRVAAAAKRFRLPHVKRASRSITRVHLRY